MKRLLFFVLAWLFLAGTADAVTRKTVTKNIDGTMSHVTAYVTESGQTVWAVDTTSGVSFFMDVLNVIELNASSSSGVSQLSSGTSGQIVVYKDSVSARGIDQISGGSIYGTIPNSVLPDPITDPEIRVTSTATAGIWVVNLTGNPVALAGGKTGTTITGASCYGGWGKSGTQAQIGNNTTEVTAMMTSAVKGMSHVFRILQDTAKSGGTINVLFEAGDNIVSQTTITAGISKYILSGTTFTDKLILTSSAVSEWEVDEIGSPSVEWD